MLIRTIQETDLDALMTLARATGVGVTTLAPNADRLAARITASQESLAGQRTNADASYVFVLEDEQSGQIVGSCAVESAVGLNAAWYNYRVGLAVHSSQELGIYERLHTLFLTSDLTGASELCSLFLLPQARKSGVGALLSKCRFLFMAEHAPRFSERVIAEMRGVSDSTGHSPFWEGLGRHFFRMDFASADVLSYVGNRAFIAELMPRYPIYTCLLPEVARAAIAEVHPETRPARALLETEGFRYQGHIDIFDGGPSLECATADIRAVRESLVLHARPIYSDSRKNRPWLVCNRELEGFRAIVEMTCPLIDSLPLSPQAMQRLQINEGSLVRAVPLYGDK